MTFLPPEGDDSGSGIFPSGRPHLGAVVGGDRILEFARADTAFAKLGMLDLLARADSLLPRALSLASIASELPRGAFHAEQAVTLLAPLPRPVSIRYAATDQQFAIAVRDRFGRLAKNTVLAYIEKCITSPNQIDRKTYGAGLGLYLVANAAATYVVNVAYGIATEVVCTFDRGAKSPLRLVGMFVHPGGAEMLKQGPTPDTAAGQSTELPKIDSGRIGGG